MCPIVVRDAVPVLRPRLLAPGARKRSLWISGSAGALLLFGLPLGTWSALNLERSPQARLSNGATLSLQGVWSSTPRPVIHGPVWMQRLFPFIPEGVRLSMDCYLTGAPSWENTGLCTTVFYRGRNRSATPVVLDDLHGCRFFASDRSDGVSAELALSTDQFAMAPRSEPEFRLRAYFRDFGGDVSANWVPVVNPERMAMPTWTADSLPSERSAGGFRCQLLSVRAGLSRDGRRPAHPNEEPHVVVEVKSPPGSQPVAVRFTDSSGATATQPVRLLDTGPDSHRVIFPLSLCRRQSAYGMRLKFSAVEVEGAAPDRTWTARGVTLAPFTGHSQSLGRNGPLLRWVVHEPGGMPGESRLAKGSLGSAPQGWHYRIRSPKLKKGSFYVVQPARWRGGLPQFEIPLSPGGTTTDFVVEGFRSRSLDWKVKPEWPEP